jgi:hypothetical protein
MAPPTMAPPTMAPWTVAPGTVAPGTVAPGTVAPGMGQRPGRREAHGVSSVARVAAASPGSACSGWPASSRLR